MAAKGAAFVEPFNLEEPIENPAPPVVTMDDNRTMAQLLEAPTVGYEDAIVVPEITADNFELKHDSLNSAAGGNFLDKMPRDCLRIIESKAKVRNSRNKPVVAKVIQPPVYQAPAYQAPAPQIQGVSKEDFQAYVKANDAVMRNMQTQGSGTLPSNTVTNMKEDLKGITTRSGVAYKGLTIPTSSPKVVERETEVTKDTMHPTNNGSTEDVQPPVVPVVHFLQEEMMKGAMKKLTTKLRNSTKSLEI
ncbi:hypothetical protein Tco_0408177 [Tanacetum coccineum]